MKLLNKVALVTGAGRGLGRAIALALAREGAETAINDIDLPAAERAASEVEILGRRSLAIKADVSSKTEVEEMVRRVIKDFGTIDILVNNAGMLVVGASAELEESLWRKCLDVNLTGLFFCCQAAGKEMIKQKKGKIINIASVGGIGALPERACYGSAKAAVIHLTKILGCEWAVHNINVNAIAPGYCRTEMVADLLRRGLFDEKILATRIYSEEAYLMRKYWQPGFLLARWRNLRK